MGGARWKVKDTSTYQPNNCPSGIVKVRLSVFFIIGFHLFLMLVLVVGCWFLVGVVSFLMLLMLSGSQVNGCK